jgi:TolB-like protein
MACAGRGGVAHAKLDSYIDSTWAVLELRFSPRQEGRPIASITSTKGASGATIAVLPFDDLSGHAEQEYFARGFVEDLITDLSRFPTLEVIHPRTSFALRPDGQKPQGGGSERQASQVGYWLRGSVRRMDETLRITAQLVEAESGRQVWADRYDAPVCQALEIQDEISANVAGALAVKIDTTRLGQARRKPLASLEAYDCWLRGMDHLRRGTVADDAHAREFFERALALDPNYARAHAGVSLSYFSEWSCQAWERWDENEQRAFASARRAVELEESDAVVHIVLARIHLYRREFAQTERHLERALALTPHSIGKPRNRSYSRGRQSPRRDSGRRRHCRENASRDSSRGCGILCPA